MKIRKFQKKDAEACSKIISETVKHEGIISKKAQGEIINASKAEALIERIKKRQYFICEENKKIIGIGALNKNQVRTMYTLPKFQNKGIGTLILKQIEKQAKKGNFKKLILYTHPKSEKFYQKNGFKIIKELSYEGDPVLYMEKKL